MYLFLFLLFASWRTLVADETIVTITRVELSAVPSDGWKKGEKLELKCSAEISKKGDSLLEYEFTFYKNENLIYSNISIRENMVYTFNPARVSNSGIYQCQVKVKGKEKKSKELQIKVTGLSKPILTLSKTEVKEGEEIPMTCEVPGENSPFRFVFSKIEKGKKKDEKIKMSLTNKQEVFFTIEEGERHLTFNCTAKIDYIIGDETSIPSESQVVTVAELFSTPRIEVFPSSNFTEGTNMSIKCSILKNSMVSKMVEITIGKGKAILESSKTENVVYSKIATVSQMGNYTCKAESNTTSKASSVYIYVAELFPKPHLKSNIKNSSMNERNPLSLSCSIPWLPYGVSINQSYYLQKNNQPKILMDKEGVYSKNAMEMDSGSYVCEVTISNITKKSNTIDIKVYAPVSKPVLTHIIRSNNIVVLGQTLELSCKSEKGTPPITYSLLRGNEHLGKIEVKRSEAAVFRVNVSKPHDLRQYQCLAENRNTAYHQSSDTINITVIVPVKSVILTIIPSNGAVEEGSELTLLCSVKNGTLPITFKFYVKRGQDFLLHTKSVNDKPYAKFEILSFSKQDDGSYFCKASNQAIVTIRSNEVSVKAVLATWKKGLISAIVIFIIVAALAISIYFYLERKKKGSEIALNMTRTTNSNVTNSSKETPVLKSKIEEDSYFVSGTVQIEDENHVKTPEENQGNNVENHEVDYTEVDVTTPNSHQDPVKKGTETVYSEIRKSNYDAVENNSNNKEDTSEVT